LERETEDQDGDGADDDGPAELGLGRVLRTAAQRLAPSGERLDDVFPEVQDDRYGGAELDNRGERGAGIFLKDQRGAQADLSVAADGKEGREALDDSVNDGVK
jgi:hypothetical protein